MFEHAITVGMVLWFMLICAVVLGVGLAFFIFLFVIAEGFKH